MLNISNLHAEVDGKAILKGITLGVNPGEIHAIMGPNGAGKSTLAYTLGGRPGYDVTEGTATFEGADLFGLEPQDLPSGAPAEIARRLGIAAELLSDTGQAAVEVEIWSPELGPRIVEIDTRAIVRTRIAGHGADRRIPDGRPCRGSRAGP